VQERKEFLIAGKRLRHPQDAPQRGHHWAGRPRWRVTMGLMDAPQLQQHGGWFHPAFSAPASKWWSGMLLAAAASANMEGKITPKQGRRRAWRQGHGRPSCDHGRGRGSLEPNL
jgi:hypothetical protein